VTATVRPLGAITRLNGQAVRLWQGQTDSGTPIVLFVPLVCAVDPDQLMQLREELADGTADDREVPISMLISPAQGGYRAYVRSRP
jgi:hypothetical protein